MEGSGDLCVHKCEMQREKGVWGMGVGRGRVTASTFPCETVAEGVDEVESVVRKENES